MARSADAELPPEEPLFRSIEEEWVAPSGTWLTAQAVDLPATSFNRSKFSRPEQARTAGRPKQTLVACFLCAHLPEPVPRAEASEPPYEYFAADDPNPPEDPENEAHAEVRVRRRGTAYSTSHRISSKVTKMAVRDALARKMRPHCVVGSCACGYVVHVGTGTDDP